MTEHNQPDSGITIVYDETVPMPLPVTNAYTPTPAVESPFHYPKPLIHAAMLAVAKGMEKRGIEKESTSAAEGRYKYRGIDAALNVFSTELAAAGVTYAPSYQIVSQADYRGKGLITTVLGTFTFYAVDGSSRVVGPIVGEAFDGMDKGCSKAMSVALRNALLQTFVVPLGPKMDPEESDAGYDDASWLEAIRDATDQTELAHIGAQLKTATGIPPPALKSIRAAYAAKLKELPR